MSTWADRRKTVDLQNSLVMIPWLKKSWVIKSLMSKSCSCNIPKLFNWRRWQHIGMVLSETQKKTDGLMEEQKNWLYWTNTFSWTSVERWTCPSVACRSSFSRLMMTLPDFDSFSSSFLCKESRNPPLCSTLGTSVANLVLSLFEANSCPVAKKQPR